MGTLIRMDELDEPEKKCGTIASEFGEEVLPKPKTIPTQAKHEPWTP